MDKKGSFKNFYLAFPTMIVLTSQSRNQCEDSASCHAWSPDYISWNQGNNHWGRGGGEEVSRLRGPMWGRLYQGLDFLTSTVPRSNREVTRTFGSLGISVNSRAIAKSPEKIQVVSSFLWMNGTHINGHGFLCKAPGEPMLYRLCCKEKLVSLLLKLQWKRV